MSVIEEIISDIETRKKTDMMNGDVLNLCLSLANQIKEQNIIIEELKNMPKLRTIIIENNE